MKKVLQKINHHTLIVFLVVAVSFSLNDAFGQCSAIPVKEAVRNGDFEAGYIPGPAMINGPFALGSRTHTFTPGGPFDFYSDLAYGGIWDPKGACNTSLGDGYGVGRVEDVSCNQTPNNPAGNGPALVYGNYSQAVTNYKDHTTGTNKGFALIIDFYSSSGGAYKKAWAQTVDIYPAQTYYFSAFFAQYGANSVPQLRFRIEVLDAGGGIIENKVLGAATPNTAWVWQQFNQTYITPVNAVKANIYIEAIASGASNAEDLLIDDISFINGCQKIVGNREPIFAADTVNICTSNSSTLNLTASYTGDPNVGNNIVTWYKGTSSTQTQVQTGASLSYSASQADEYRVCVQDPENGCATSATVVVNKSIKPTLGDVVLCSPPTATLTPVVVPTGTFNYVWSGAGSGTAASCLAATSGAYTVTVTNPNVPGCSGSATSTVTSKLPTAPTNLTYCDEGGVSTNLIAGGTAPNNVWNWYKDASKGALTGTVTNNGTASTAWTPLIGTTGDQTLYISSNNSNPVGTTGPSTSAFGTGTQAVAGDFTTIVVAQTILLKSVSAVVAGWEAPASRSVKITNTVTASSTTYGPFNIGGSATALNLNAVLTAGTYKVEIIGGGVGTIAVNVGSPTYYSNLSAYMSITGYSAHTGPFGDFVVSTSSACDPMP
ncbi:MAG: hypothetical protein RL060_1981, partial [Bacteroidota bacterium]